MMMGSMFTMNHYLKIIYFIMKSVLVFMVDVLVCLKFATKVLFHHISVFINPSTFGVNLNLPVFNVAYLMNSPTKKGFCSGMVHTTHSFRHMLFHCGFIPWLLKTLGALAGIVKGFSIPASHGSHGVATDTTGFLDKCFHRLHYMPTKNKAQAIYGGVI